jgi:hypothetical protein
LEIGQFHAGVLLKFFKKIAKYEKNQNNLTDWLKLLVGREKEDSDAPMSSPPSLTVRSRPPAPADGEPEPMLLSFDGVIKLNSLVLNYNNFFHFC